MKDVQAKVEQNGGVAYDSWKEWHVRQPANFTIEQITAYVFVIDAMNFCFWPGQPKAKQPLPEQKTECFEYENISRNLETLLIEDPEFFTCQRLLQIDQAILNDKVFNTEPHFCLIDERVRIVREMAFVIQRDYESSFEQFVQKSNYDCVKLVDMIVSSFSGFRDEAIFKGKQVFFYKRAQILVSDLIGAYQDYSKEMGMKFTNKSELTMFADYRVPQILRHLKILEYSEHLA